MPSWQDIQVFLDAHPYWAYLVLFVWTFIEGETVLIIAAFAARDGHPNIVGVILSAFAGSLAGDQTWFFVGRKKGKAFLAKRPVWQKRADKVIALLHEHQNWLMIGFRFLYGLRNITPFALGMSEVKAGKFITFNVIGAAVWAVSFGLLGFLFGMAVETQAKHLKLPVLLAFAAIILAIWASRVFIRWRKSKASRQG